MKLLILLLIFTQLPASALNRTFLRMPEDSAYMNFTLTRYLSWHRKNFAFPEDSELLRTLVSGLDHFVVSGNPYLRQFTISHSIKEGDKPHLKIRLYVHPSLRNLKELQARELPGDKELWFVEWDKEGKSCRVYREKDESFSGWCRLHPSQKFKHAWTERIAEKLPAGWNVPFPVMGEKFIQREVSGEVTDITFFDVSPHPSMIPRILMKSVYLHTKDALLPLDRLNQGKEGQIGILYP